MEWVRIRQSLLVALAVSGAGAGNAPAAPVTAGWIERARLAPGDLVVQAKLDTGAETSSLHAPELQRFQRDGKDWAAFDVIDDAGKSVRLERPVVRSMAVRSALGAGQVRAVVRLGICIGDVYRVTDVNLIDRGRMAQRLLIGRRFLESHLLVDSARTHTREPACGDVAPP